MSIPHLTELAHKYQGKATFTGVSVWENNHPASDNAAYMERIKDFVKEMGDKMDYHVAADDVSKPVMAESWMKAADQNGIPTAFVIDRQGKIAWIGHPMDGLDEAVGKVIDGTFDEKAEAAKVAKAAEEQEKRQAEFAPLTKAMKAKDYATALTEIDKISANHPEMAGNLAFTKYNILLKTNETAAYALANKLAEGTFKDNAQALNAIAWPIVDDNSKLKTPDYATAIAIAKRAADLSKNADPMILDTYAYALYKGGKVADAITIETNAISLSKKPGSEVPADTVTELEGRLDTMKKKQS
jgi:tetratricopeptide (TPR) repeat protein